MGGMGGRGLGWAGFRIGWGEGVRLEGNRSRGRRVGIRALIGTEAWGRKAKRGEATKGNRFEIRVTEGDSVHVGYTDSECVALIADHFHRIFLLNGVYLLIFVQSYLFLPSHFSLFF